MSPNFLIIGAQKSGTTWLSQNLKAHSQIWFPPDKEIHYFDLPKKMPFIFFLLAPKRNERRWVINRIKGAYYKTQADQNKNANWLKRAYLLPRTDDWYISLFTPSQGQISGEATPDYALLSDKMITHVHRLLPDAKIIYLLRHPVQRLWSQAAMSHSERFGHEGIQTISDKRLISFLKKPENLAHSHYLTNLEKWEKHYPPEQIFTGFFEDISNNPRKLLKSIFQFLGVDASDKNISAIAYRKIHGRDYPPLPNCLAYEPAGLLIKEIEQLHERFDNSYTEQWLSSTCHLLS